MYFKKTIIGLSILSALTSATAFAGCEPGDDFPTGSDPFYDNDIEFSDVVGGDGINNNFGSAEAERIAQNVMSFQSNHGGWPKNICNMHYDFSSSELTEIRNSAANKSGTLDNDATSSHLEYLAKVYNASSDDDLKDDIKSAYRDGVDFLLEMQYENGGFPQSWPTSGGYDENITYNDGAMTHAMELLREIAAGNSPFTVPLGSSRTNNVDDAIEAGIQVMLDTQYKQNGTPTVWGQQHDKDSLLPTTARSYEVASLSGGESSGVVELLTDIYKETSRSDILASIEYAVKWYGENRIVGHKLISQDSSEFVEASNNTHPDTGYRNRYVVIDNEEEDKWARMAELHNNKPLFVDRDTDEHYNFNDMDLQAYSDADRPSGEPDTDRRQGYSWYSDNGFGVFENFASLIEDEYLSATAYQAEDAILNSGVSVDSNSKAEGSKIVDFSDSGSISLENVDGGANGGAHFIIARFALKGDSRRGEFQINNQGWNNFFTMEGISDGWSDFGYDTVAVVELDAGSNNTIDIRSVGNDLGNLDAIYIYSPTFLGDDDAGGGSSTLPDLDITETGTYTVAINYVRDENYVRVRTDQDDKLRADISANSLDELPTTAKFLLTRLSNDKVIIKGIDKPEHVRLGDPDSTLYCDISSEDNAQQFELISTGSEDEWHIYSGEEYVQRDGTYLMANRSKSNKKTKFVITPLHEQIFQAEDATLKSVDVSNEHDGAIAEDYVDFESNSSSVKFKNIEGYGRTAELHIRYATTSNRKGRISINGVEQDFTMEDTDGWDNWETSVITISLEDNSKNEIEFTTPSGYNFGNLDQVMIRHQ